MRSCLHSLLFLFSVFVSVGVAREGEHYFRFVVREKADLDLLTRMVSIDNVVRDTVFAYANQKQWNAFRQLGYDIVELPHPGSQFSHKMSDVPLGVMEWDQYPTYQAYLTMINQFAVSYPLLCRLDTIGYTNHNHQILVLKISDSVDVHEDEPQVLYTSTMHGDETVGYVLLLRLADFLLTTYGQPTPEGDRVTNLLNNVEIWINPLFNPDGTYRLTDTTVSTAWRGNANGVDLNRDFPDRISDTVNTTAGRELETQLMMEWTRRHNFTLSANFHGGAQVANYPWDNGAPSGTYSMSPDDAWFIHVARAYATPNPDLMNGGFTNGITNGCRWYAIFGGRQDWMYWWNGGRELTIELYNTKSPPGSLLPQRWTNNKESFLAYVEETLKGIRGIVTDAATHAPVKARVALTDIPGAPVFTDSTIGDYHRLVLPGVYALVVSAPGYVPDTVRNISVDDSIATRVDVSLQPQSTLMVHRGSDALPTYSLFQNYPNPFNPTTLIRFSISSPGHMLVRVFDILGKAVATVLDEHLPPGNYAVPFDATGFPSGIYFYMLSSESGISVTRKLVVLR